MSTLTTHVAVHLSSPTRKYEVFTGRTPLGIDIGTTEERRIRSKLDMGTTPNPVTIGPITGFAFIRCGIPFNLNIVSSGGSIDTTVEGMFMAYLSATEMTISWGSPLIKDVELNIYYG